MVATTALVITNENTICGVRHTDNRRANGSQGDTNDEAFRQSASTIYKVGLAVSSGGKLCPGSHFDVRRGGRAGPAPVAIHRRQPRGRDRDGGAPLRECSERANRDLGVHLGDSAEPQSLRRDSNR